MEATWLPFVVQIPRSQNWHFVVSFRQLDQLDQWNVPATRHQANAWVMVLWILPRLLVVSPVQLKFSRHANVAINLRHFIFVSRSSHHFKPCLQAAFLCLDGNEYAMGGCRAFASEKQHEKSHLDLLIRNYALQRGPLWTSCRTCKSTVERREWCFQKEIHLQGGLTQQTCLSR